MPADHGSRCNQNQRLFPSEPHLPQHNPEQLMQGGQSTTRTFGVQSQQLLTESEIFKDEVLPGTKGTDNPSQKMSERGDDDRNHGQNLIEKRRIPLACNSFIPRVHEVLTRDRHSNMRKSGSCFSKADQKWIALNRKKLPATGFTLQPARDQKPAFSDARRHLRLGFGFSAPSWGRFARVGAKTPKA